MSPVPAAVGPERAKECRVPRLLRSLAINSWMDGIDCFGHVGEIFVRGTKHRCVLLQEVNVSDYTHSVSSPSTSFTPTSSPAVTTQTTTRLLQKHSPPNMRRRLGIPELSVLVVSSMLLGYSIPNEFRLLNLSQVRYLVAVPQTVSPNATSTASNKMESEPFETSSDADALRDYHPGGNTTSLHPLLRLETPRLRGSAVMMDPRNRPQQSSNNSNLQIAWLMSFPNSGTSYTAQMIRDMSRTKTGSNYAVENLGGDGRSVPVFAHQPSGPFYVDPLQHRAYRDPTEFVLTKTHCGGSCERCAPTLYTETTFSFRHRCLRSKWVQKMDSNGTTQTTTVVHHGSYAADRVTKAVHLIRDPFDNVVSRFHLEQERHPGQSNGGVPAVPNDDNNPRERFRAFCETLNQKHAREERQAVWLAKNAELDELTADIPCRADFFRYVEWHNMAFVTTRDMELETYILHYDWYATRFEETVDELLDFLHLEKRGKVVPFQQGKVYDDYFTADERVRMKIAIRWMASPVLLGQLSRYLL